MKKLNRKSISVATVVVVSILALLLGAAATPTNRVPGDLTGQTGAQNGAIIVPTPPPPESNPPGSVGESKEMISSSISGEGSVVVSGDSDSSWVWVYPGESPGIGGFPITPPG